MPSFSDDSRHKIKYDDFINKCHDISDAHEHYCNTNCFKDNRTGWYPHTRRCIEYRQAHHESFVECNSVFCLKMNEESNLIPSYSKPNKEIEVITELTYYSDDE